MPDCLKIQRNLPALAFAVLDATENSLHLAYQLHSHPAFEEREENSRSSKIYFAEFDGGTP